MTLQELEVPPKIIAEEREQLEVDLQNPPTDLGYDRQAWSPKLLLHYVKEKFDVEYTGCYTRSLLHEADPEEEAEFKQTVEKTTRTDRQDRRRG
ncbi:hypothetical protein [Natrinema versiforme]|uniref:hypothetical protein n=1 Tax=Natrinema versiforme TaxID=88724 RepID=UPI001E5A422E|nr:hypothetical protein [Natrinema versiforme]